MLQALEDKVGDSTKIHFKFFLHFDVWRQNDKNRMQFIKIYSKIVVKMFFVQFNLDFELGGSSGFPYSKRRRKEENQATGKTFQFFSFENWKANFLLIMCHVFFGDFLLLHVYFHQCIIIFVAVFKILMKIIKNRVTTLSQENLNLSSKSTPRRPQPTNWPPRLPRYFFHFYYNILFSFKIIFQFSIVFVKF